MEDKDTKLLLLTSKIIAGAGVVFAAVEFLSDNFFNGLLILLLIMFLTVPIFLFHKGWDTVFASNYLSIGVFLVVLFIECLKKEVDMMFPLYIACFAVGAIFFRLQLLKTLAVVINVCLIAVFLIGGSRLCVSNDIAFLARSFAAMNVCFLLVYSAIKWGSMYLENARKAGVENESLMDKMEKHLAENQRSIDKQNKLLNTIDDAAGNISRWSEQVSTGAQNLSQGAAEQAGFIEELAASVTEISEQAKNTAMNATAASEQANQAGINVTACNGQMQEVTKAIAEITQKSHQIEKIIKTIEDIAFQTNILALNAAVEAARAGAAGKGFSVVAGEVRNLAGKSSEASKNTAALIEDSIQAVKKGTIIADETAKSLLQVVESTRVVSETVEKITQASTAQAISISEITQGIEQISSVIQTNSANAEESASTSEELSSQAQMLKTQVGSYQL